VHLLDGDDAGESVVANHLAAPDVRHATAPGDLDQLVAAADDRARLGLGWAGQGTRHAPDLRTNDVSWRTMSRWWFAFMFVLGCGSETAPKLEVEEAGPYAVGTSRFTLED